MSAWKPSESWTVSRGRSPTRSAHPCPERTPGKPATSKDGKRRGSILQHELDRDSGQGSQSLGARPVKETHQNRTEATQLWDRMWTESRTHKQTLNVQQLTADPAVAGNPTGGSRRRPSAAAPSAQRRLGRTRGRGRDAAAGGRWRGRRPSSPPRTPAPVLGRGRPAVGGEDPGGAFPRPGSAPRLDPPRLWRVRAFDAAGCGRGRVRRSAFRTWTVVGHVRVSKTGGSQALDFGLSRGRTARLAQHHGRAQAAWNRTPCGPRRPANPAPAASRTPGPALPPPRRRWPRRASGPAWRASRARRGTGRARVLAGSPAGPPGRWRPEGERFGAAYVAAVLAARHQRSASKSEKVALERGCLDAVVTGLLFHGRDAREEGSRDCCSAA